MLLMVVVVSPGEGPLIPVSQLPSHCGFSVKRSRRDVTFRAPYQGCHVSQQVRPTWASAPVHRDLNRKVPYFTTGWQLRATVALLWVSDDGVVSRRFAAALRHLLQVWDGAEDQWCDGQSSPRQRSEPPQELSLD